MSKSDNDSLDDGEQDTLKYHSKLPVFCTAKIPEEVLNELIEDSDFEFTSHRIRPYIFGPNEIAKLPEIKPRSTAPMASFEPPFANQSITEMNEFYMEKILPTRRNVTSTFVILDERTVDDKTCLLVHGGQHFSDDDETRWIRCGLWAAYALTLGTEARGELGEGLDRETVWEDSMVDV